ncbi:MAG: S4 domain-containing protein [Candidatus Anstonellales archaeon]
MGIKHYVRITAPSNIPVKMRKSAKWLCAPRPGPHKKSQSVSALVLLRDFLGVASTSKEAEFLISRGRLEVDGKKISDKKFPIGLMDIIHLPLEDKYYIVTIKSGKLSVQPLPAELASKKYCKIVKKYTIKGGQLKATTHDGRSITADKDTKVGDTAVLEIPSGKVVALLKRKEGARCLITAGKHAGLVGKMGKIIERKGSMGSEAEISYGNGSFITVLDYVFIIDENYRAE